MDPSDLLPGLDKMVKEKFRKNEEPKDFAYWLMVVVTLAACLGVILVPLIPNPLMDTDGRREDTGRG